jgi:flagellar biosynthesis/type III secretory pathway protein FliH
VIEPRGKLLFQTLLMHEYYPCIAGHGREEGREQGREEARKEWREEGQQEGRTAGREEGRKEGRKEGRRGDAARVGLPPSRP